MKTCFALVAELETTQRVTPASRVLGRQAVHVGLAFDADAVEIADGVRRLLGQLVRENVCVDICDLHGMTSVYIAYAEIQTK
ncbi:MAG: hypothetical protein ACLUFI_10865 [Oscillospiraceae bacterium]